MVDQIAVLLCLIAFCTAAYTDIRNRTIPNWPHLLLLAAGLMRMVASGSFLDPLLGFIGLGGGLFLLGVFRGGIGGGDVKLIAASCLVFGLSLGIWGVLFSLILSLLYGLAKKATSICYAPFHGAGFITAFLLNGGF